MRKRSETGKKVLAAGLYLVVLSITWIDVAEAGETYWTCPMHPQIVQQEPGTCPICGMDLVEKQSPRTPEENGKPAGDEASRKIKHWVAPMDPTYIRDEPGKSPMGMDLVPVYEDDGAPRSAPGTVIVDPVMVQNMGVRVAQVRRGVITRRVRTIGEVDVAENQISVVNLRFSGWIEKIYVDETGQKVRRGQALFSIYSPELVSAQKEYLIAYNTSGPDSPLTRAAADRIRYWDVPDRVLDEVVQEQNVDRTIVIRSPRGGFILHKNVVEGARVKEGTDLYRIGNLKKIWVNAEVYEFDAPWIEEGQTATMELSFQRGRTFSGKVDYIYPTLNRVSRTLTVRLEFENPGIELKPGMFATVRIAAQRREGVLMIPSEAVLHSGERQVVFVTRGIGKYEPREIVTGLIGTMAGAPVGGRVTEVRAGLQEGETVVTSGQFLLDSESQLQEAVQKLQEARLQSKGEADAEGSDSRAGAGFGSGGESYWTCPMHPQIIEQDPGTCPICGMDLVEKKTPEGEN